MKKILFLAIIASFFGCNDTKTDTKSTSSTSDTTQVNSTYEVMYSAKWDIDNKQNVNTVMTIWKAWDDGNLMTVKDHFADSLTMFISNGMVVNGTRDSVLAVGQGIRDMYTTVKSRLDIYIPLKSTDRDENWVSVWGTEITTDKKGKTDSVHLHEGWMFNKNGKVRNMFQYARAAYPPKL